MALRAYIVDDSSMIRHNLAEALSELAHVDPVGMAETEQEGRSWLTQHEADWDLAIVDLFLREGSGMNIVAACSDRREEQKMVVLTNHATAEVRRRCSALGADAVFDKSTEIEALVDYCLDVTTRQAPH